MGFFLDAVDSTKFAVPTTCSEAKSVGRLHRIKQKLTAVQMFSDDRLLFFRTLPDVRTGGNLTLTILTRLFMLGYFNAAVDVYINFDGASDNVCYTVVYAVAHLLVCASRAG